MTENIQTKRCGRCHSNKSLDTDFVVGKGGNYLSSCNFCREYFKQRQANKQEIIQQQQKHYYLENREAKIEQSTKWRNDNIDRLTAKIECPCGGKFQYRTKAEHERSNKHKKYIQSLND